MALGIKRDAGGDRLAVASGGVIDVESGGALKVAGTDVTAVLAAALAGVASGYKVARGTVTPTSASHTVATGLATVVAAVASARTFELTHMFTGASIGNQTDAPVAGSILIISEKPTATGNVTPVAATDPWSVVEWIAVGT